MRPNEKHLAIFLKEPRLGRVKGRLAHDIGRPAAWRFYRGLVRKVVPPLAADQRWTTWLATTPHGWHGQDPLWPFAGRHIAQGSGDLGRRMLRVFRNLPPGPAIIVGSDIPALAPAHIVRAFETLGSADVVFGPATDGGYWLIGVSTRGRLLHLFDGVPWSTPETLAKTRRNVPASYRVGWADQLSDVDDGPAWRAHASAGVVPRAQASADVVSRAQASATHSISMSNSIGQDAMATNVRAGGSFGK
jgi:rSAM/selenodomain-associated transferase 1